MSSNISPNPNIVEGPRKRLPSKRVTENGDQLSNKKARTPNTAKTLTNKSLPKVRKLLPSLSPVKHPSKTFPTALTQMILTMTPVCSHSKKSSPTGNLGW